MKTKKLLVAFLLVAAWVMSVLTGCAEPGGDVTVGLPDGAPALAFAELIAERSQITANYNVKYDVLTADGSTEAATVVGTKIVNGDYQMAVLPTNVAANLYKKGAPIKILTVNTWGNLYMVSKSGTVGSLSELKGKIVYNISRNGVPNVVFTNLLNKANIEWDDNSEEAQADKVVIKYMAASAMIPALKLGSVEYGILGEPAASRANAGAMTSTVFDFQIAWAEAYGGSVGYPQASLVVRSDFYADNGAFVDALVARLATNEEYLRTQDNVDKVVEKVSEIAPATSLSGLKVATVSRCAVRVRNVSECKEAVNTFLAAFGIEVDGGFFA